MPDTPRSTGFSLRRWSQRKLAAARGEHDARPDESPVRDAASNARLAEPAAPLTTDHPPVASGLAATEGLARSDGPPAIGNAARPLPPLESLTIDSDFSPFMQPGVDETLKRAALRKLLRDPRFNVMDGLDVYIDDYSKPSPIEPDLVRTLVQARYIFDPPKTRVTDEGIVEDVPDEPIAVASDVAAAEGGAAPALPDAATDANPVAAPALAEESATIPAPVEPSKSP
jgi:hypothetical protein